MDLSKKDITCFVVESMMLKSTISFYLLEVVIICACASIDSMHKIFLLVKIKCAIS